MKNYLIICCSLILALITRVFLVSVYKIPSDSMSPTILSGDYILASQISYGLKLPWGDDVWFKSKPQKSDLIIFSYKNKPAISYIKRVIAVEGEDFRSEKGLEKIPANEVCVLSDNPLATDDSRQLGSVPINQIEGKALFILFSFSTDKEVRWNRFFRRL